MRKIYLQKIRHPSHNIRLFIFGTPLYANYGDLAIALSEIQFFKENFSDVQCVDVPREYWEKEKQTIISMVTEKDLIFITGGGFLGDVWLDEEMFVMDVLNTFRTNVFVFLPHSIDFKTNTSERKHFEEINRLPYKWLCFREQHSYEIAKKYIDEKICFLIPDMVLNLQIQKNSEYEANNKVKLCLRKDREGVLTSDVEKKIENFFRNRNIQIEFYTTSIGKYAPLSAHKKMINQKIEELQTADWVVTDRLHCMIFSLICGKPVAFFDNSNKKLSGCYGFLKEKNYAIYIENGDDIEDKLSDLIIRKTYVFDKSMLEKYYAKLKKIIYDALEFKKDA